MVDAAQLIAPLRGALVPVPAQPQDGVCSTCHSSARPGFSTCRPCADATSLTPPEILPITLSVDGGLMHSHLRGYKDSPSSAARARMGLRLAGLLATFLARHGRCIGAWDIVTCVPSPERVALEAVVTRIAMLEDAYHQVLAARGGTAARSLGAGRFAVTDDVRTRRVLLLDDTVASGARLFSAAAALRRSGAAIVGPVVLGRHIHPGWPPTGDLLSWIERIPWDEHRCARCAGARRHTALP